ncbi:MAG: hypothetical protein EA376_07060 [Phycisphaeraceae bacterium]|nr:MAG: hypothetical protein EA376_07060 [Phycisphaeraceae bacterium]
MTHRRRNLSCALLATGLAGAMLLTTGCGGAWGYRLNPSPEVRTTALTTDEVFNKTTITFDTQFRLFLEDFSRLTLTDRPTRMTPRPMPW